jgi:hypothetical protein|nr:MAG TPA: Protein of unknown function (DUF1642) [Caudoviricetes sp.]
MMNKDEAVQKLATAGRLSIAHAEDLYDSLFPKPVVPQYVADWYEEHKGNIDYGFWEYLVDWEQQEPNDFKNWVSREYNTITTLANMHQFGYEVEEEKRYTVMIKAVLGQYLGRYYLNDEELTPQFSRTQFTLDGERPTFTRKELENAGFGWVFNCEGIEIEEVE